MRIRDIVSCIVAFWILSSNAQAGFIINFAQIGNDVVATGSGSANLSGLSFLTTFQTSQINLDASSGNFRGGAAGVPYDLYQGLTPNTSFGPGTGTNNIPNSSSGDYFGLTAFNGRLFLPNGYVSGTQLSNSTTWNNRTIENLGLPTVGSTFTYTWGSGGNADSLTINVAAVPEPSSAICLIVGAIITVMRRRSRNLPQLAGNDCGNT